MLMFQQEVFVRQHGIERKRARYLLHLLCFFYVCFVRWKFLAEISCSQRVTVVKLILIIACKSNLQPFLLSSSTRWSQWLLAEGTLFRKNKTSPNLNTLVRFKFSLWSSFFFSWSPHGSFTDSHVLGTDVSQHGLSMKHALLEGVEITSPNIGS